MVPSTPAELLRDLLYQMAGDQGVVGGLGADPVRRDGPVAQARHQHRIPLLQVQQAAQLRRQCPGRPWKRVLLPAQQAIQLHRDIGPHRLAQGLGAAFVQDTHSRDLVALPHAVPGLHASELRGLPRLLLPELCGLHRQVCPPFQHVQYSFRGTRYGAVFPIWYYFLPKRRSYAKR